MLITPIVQSDNDRLILFFLGWTGHSGMLDEFRPKGYDLVALSDYRDLSFDPTIVKGYDEVIVIGWSFGVAVADRVVPLADIVPAKSIAINGTCRPVDNNDGIPERIFALTLRSIEKEGIDTFSRRMCGDFPPPLPSPTPFSQLLEELRLLGEMFRNSDPQRGLDWDYALVGEEDRIFPVQNMLAFWNKRATFVSVREKMPHYPFTAEGIDRLYRILNDEQPR